MVRQKEIARKLNLSVMTVSKALRNHPDLAEATKQRVIQKALEMGYTDIPAIDANKRRPLGVLGYSSSSDDQPLLESEIRRRILESIQQECARNRIETVIEFANVKDIPLLVANNSVNGVFILGRYTPEAVANLRGIPALAVSNFIESSLLPRITADNQGGIRQVTEHLISLGHRDILFLGQEETGSDLQRVREEGCILQMRRHGLSLKTLYFPQQLTGAIVDEVLKHTAVVCASDSLAHSLIKALRLRGKAAPQDISIVGFDNLVAGDIDFLTTYAPNCKLMGEMAVQLMLAGGVLVNAQDVHITVPGELVIRHSTAPARTA